MDHFTILFNHGEHFTSLHSRNVQKSSAHLHNLASTGGMGIIPSKRPLKSVSSLSTNVIMAGVGYIGSLLLDMFYFAETHAQTTHHKVKVALIVSVDLNNLAMCQQEFCHLDAKQVFNTILMQSTSQNKLKFLLFPSLSELNFSPGKLSLNRVHRDDFPDLKPV